MGLLIRFYFLVVVTIASAEAAYAQNISDNHSTHIERLKEILQLQESEIDLGKVALTVDQMVNPSIDIAESQRQISKLIENIYQRLSSSAGQIQKIEAIRDLIYKPGSWNQMRPFQYDLSDPFGKNIQNKLLSTYLKARKGNCVSMPLLFVILGQRIGANLTLASAPNHIFVMYEGSDGQFHSFEATSGGPILHSTLRKSFPMTDRSIAVGTYLRPLTKKESTVVIASLLLDIYAKQGNFEAMIPMIELLQPYHRRNHALHLYRHMAYLGILRRDYLNKFAGFEHIPTNQRTRYEWLEYELRASLRSALDLGWREASPESTSSYLTAVRSASEKLNAEAQK
jgi:regulator of sirC expression with transglutaminase-like and TPR domain